MAARATHVFPVVRKRTTTDAADLLVMAAQTAMRPGEPVRAESDKEGFKKLDDILILLRCITTVTAMASSLGRGTRR